MHRDESFRRLRGTGGSVQLTLRIVRTGSAQEDASITLGAALINRQAGGVLATVYFTRVA